MISPLATVIDRPATNPSRALPIRGVAIHTTGSGLPRDAVASRKDPLQAAIDYYRVSKGPTYVIGWDGRIAAIFGDELAKTWHVGVEANELPSVRDGTWRQMVSPATAAAWDRRWPGKRGPLDLIGGALPNEVTIGIETIPVTDGQTLWYPPAAPGLRFSAAQHASLRRLVADIARRHRFPSGWQRTHVFGHEDLNPIRRHDAGGGWDPGALRSAPYIDMRRITGGISPLVLGALLAGGALLLWRAR